MSLRPLPVVVPFAGGIETRQDAKQVPVARLLDLQNGVFTKGTTIAKRNGYSAYGTAIEAGGGSYAGARALGVRDDELVVMTPYAAYSHRPAADRWASIGAVSAVVSSERPLVKTGSEQSQVDAATLANVTAVAWTDNRGGVWSAVVEESTGRVLRAPSQLSPAATATSPRVVPSGVVLHVYFADQAAKRLYVAIVDPANPTITPVAAVLTDDYEATPASGTWYDACPSAFAGVSGAGLSPALIAWTSTGNNIKLGYVAPSGVLGSALTDCPAPVVAVVGHPGPIAVAYGVTLGPLVAFANGTILAWQQYVATTLAAGASSASVDVGTAVANIAIAEAAASTVYVVSEFAAVTTDADRILTVTATGADLNMAITGTLRGLCMSSRMWVDDGVPYLWSVVDLPLFSVYLGLRLSDRVVIARNMPTVAHGRAAGGWCGAVTVDPTDPHRWRCPLLYNEQIALDPEATTVTTSPGFAETGARWVTLDMAPAEAQHSAQLGRGLYIASACPQHYDGDRIAELGFHYAPDGAITAVAGAAGAMTVGTYIYRAWYEEVDAQGEIHRGPVSIGVSVTLAGGQTSVTVTGPTYRTTGRRRVRICVARSTNGNATAFYRVTSLDPTAVGNNGYVVNDPTADSWSVVDGLDDVTLQTKEPLYTNGGVLSNDPAGFSGATLVRIKNRLWWTDPLEPNLVRFSQELAEGFGAEIANPLALPTDHHGGAVVGFGDLDGNAVVFKESAVNVIGGPGPLADPLADPSRAFTDAALVTSDVGCSAPRSIVQSPIGLVFRSAKGWRLLDRSRQLQDIGADARGYDGQGVTRALLIPTAQRIVMLTDVGRTLAWDYQFNLWSTYTNHTGLDAVIVGDAYSYLRTDGRVFAEVAGVYKDDNAHIPLVIETAWVKMAGFLQGWQRLLWMQLIGEYESAHFLRTRYQTDFEPGWSTPFDLYVTADQVSGAYGNDAYGVGIYGGAGDNVYQRRVHINRRCQSMRFRFEDVEGTGAGTKASLDFSTATGGVFNTVIEDLTAGSAGNALTLELMPDLTVDQGTGYVLTVDGSATLLRYYPSATQTLHDLEVFLNNNSTVLHVKTQGTGAISLSTGGRFAPQALTGGLDAETFGAAFELSEMVLTGGVIRETVKLPAARST